MKPKYKAQRTFSVTKDGFFGEFYPATGEKFKGKSLIIFGGSAGLFLLTQVLSCMFVDEGMSTMAIAYQRHGDGSFVFLTADALYHSFAGRGQSGDKRTVPVSFSVSLTYPGKWSNST